MAYRVHTADLLDWLRAYDGPCFHAVLSDPPYGLAFMNKGWDSFKTPVEYQAWVTEWAALLIERALYPGAVCALFGGTRTFHRLGCGLEDAGFEVFDTMLWLYGSGFPKSHDISKSIDKAEGAEREVVGKRVYADGHVQNSTQLKPPIGTFERSQDERITTAPATPDAARFDGYGTALKPAWEPVILCRAPRGKHRFIDLALKFGTGALWIDGCRIETGESLQGSTVRNDFRGGNYGAGSQPNPGDIPDYEQSPRGRWSANVVLDEDAADMLDEQSGERVGSRGLRTRGQNLNCYGEWGPMAFDGYHDSGGASRFFYVAKASRKERDAGLLNFADDITHVAYGEFDGTPDHAPNNRGRQRNPHPTVKPISLTEYIARLMRPPELAEPRRLLVPFAGSGSEMIGGWRAGWDEIVGVEISDEYAAIAEARLEYWSTQGVQLKLF